MKNNLILMAVIAVLLVGSNVATWFTSAKVTHDADVLKFVNAERDTFWHPYAVPGAKPKPQVIPGKPVPFTVIDSARVMALLQDKDSLEAWIWYLSGNWYAYYGDSLADITVEVNGVDKTAKVAPEYKNRSVMVPVVSQKLPSDPVKEKDPARFFVGGGIGYSEKGYAFVEAGAKVYDRTYIEANYNTATKWGGRLKYNILEW